MINYLHSITGWPLWAIETLGALSLILVAISYLEYILFSSKVTASTIIQSSKSFRLFQIQYLTVFLITMLADWLQGTHMYTLYTVIVLFMFYDYLLKLYLIVLQSGCWHTFFDGISIISVVRHIPWNIC